jgi:hypothetical protein
MNDHDQHEVREALKQSFPPVDAALRRDLWPLVLQKLDSRPTHVPWYDWALMAVSTGTVLAFPQLMLVFAYHL